MEISTLKNKLGKVTRLDGILLICFTIGAVLASTSLFRGILGDGQAQIEYINSENISNNATKQATDNKIVVDIEGAVISPGVYELPVGSRLKDALVISGGYSAAADRVYCEKNLNLAQELKDGQKVYIPSLVDTPLESGYTEANTQAKLVNVNAATIAELDTLWGVGKARAETIVKNRPYNSFEELVSKGGMTKQIYEKNAGLISIF